MTTPALDPFVYQAPTPEQTERIKAIRQTCQDFASQLQNLIPRSRELSVALTKLEEVSMWANKGVVFNGSRPEPGA